ncbi:uncharacterized protein LOC142629034 [Castanea sativa]|uniref:uncharacterized protein LOC142629034 n=1 Tax=Castanea sativa TaxID=21020 RepID=UPI003F64C32A
MAKNTVDDFSCYANWKFDLTRPAPSKWILPPLGSHKVNVDGVSSDQENHSSVGVAIRDCKGQVVAALSLPLQAYYSVELTEIFAIEQGVLLAQELQLPQVIVESDSLATIQALNEKATESTFGHLIQGILRVCDSFESYHFKHLSRSYNAVAHELAQYARRTGNYQIWKGAAPSFVLSFLLTDIMY